MRFRICMIILILTGVLMGGIGAGIALAEFSELEYAGTVWLGSEKETERTLVYELSEQGADQLFCHAYMNMREQTVVEENRKVPLNEIWFEITYDPDYGEPVGENMGIYQDEFGDREEIHLWMIPNSQNELKEWMDAKDKILADLKENRISSYQYAPVICMKVQVHPENAGKLKIM